MLIEKVKLTKTLKCGSNVYGPGEYDYPRIPRDLIIEARSGSGNVEIIKTAPEPPPIIKTPKGVGTSTSAVGTTSNVGKIDVIDPDKVKAKPTQPPKPSKKPVEKAPSKKPKLKLRGKKK